MKQIVKYNVYGPLAIRKRAMDYANRPTPNLETETDQVLKYNLDLTVEQAKDQAQERLKRKKGAVIGELSQSVTVALDLYQDKEGNRKKLNKDQRELIAHVSRLVCSWLFLPDDAVFAPMSRTELTPQMINGLGRWMTEYKNDEWVQRYTFRDELSHLIHWAQTGYDMAVQAASKGDDLRLADIIESYRKDSPFGDGGEDATGEYWWLHSFDDYVEMKYNEMQENPRPKFSQKPQEAPGADLQEETVKDVDKPQEKPAQCDFFDF